MEAGIEQLIPYAQEAGIKLGVELLHFVLAADRSVIVTLGQANDIVERLGSPQVGMVVDVFHVWWDRGAEQCDPSSSQCASSLSYKGYASPLSEGENILSMGLRAPRFVQ